MELHRTQPDPEIQKLLGSSRAVRRLNDTICIENGYSIVENPKRHGKSYNKWLGDKKKPSHRERICVAIDDALAQKPDNFEALLELLRQAGYWCTLTSALKSHIKSKTFSIEEAVMKIAFYSRVDGQGFGFVLPDEADKLREFFAEHQDKPALENPSSAS